MKLILIENWRQAHKFWSIMCNALGATLMGLFSIWPDSALYLWNAMPDEVKTRVPESFASSIAAFIFVMSIVSRLIKQKSVHPNANVE